MKRTTAIRVPGKIGKHETRFLLDTGAQVNVMSEACAKLLKIGIKTLEHDVTVIGIGEKPIIPVGKTICAINCLGLLVTAEFLVMSNFTHGIILGLNFVQEYKIEINMDKQHVSSALGTVSMQECLKPWVAACDPLMKEMSKADSDLYTGPRLTKGKEKISKNTKHLEVMRSVCAIMDKWEADGLDEEPGKKESVTMNEELSPREKADIQRLILEFKDIFADGDWDIGELKGIHAKIKATSGSRVASRPRRMNPRKRAELKQHCDNLEKAGIIEKAGDSGWLSQPVIVNKKNGSTRLTIDYIQVNKHLQDLVMPTADVDAILESMGGKKYKSIVDAKHGYFQIPLHPDSRELTTFSGPHGFYQFTRLPQGLKSSPAIFQRIMNEILGDLDGNCASFYMDDCIIYSSTFTEHINHLRQVFTRFRDTGLKLALDKSKFAMFRVPFLGRLLTEDGVQPDPDKIRAITEYPTPMNAAELVRFRGMLGFHRKSIKGFAKIWKP